VRSVAELDAALANTGGRRVMLDFYADWCVSCIEMEKLTFTKPEVKTKLDQMLLLQADVTANNDEDKALLKRFGLFGPPGIILFDANGTEIRSARVIGFQPPAQFLKSLQKAE
jgi:thiol:disulfide interchange protein DsbD